MHPGDLRSSPRHTNFPRLIRWCIGYAVTYREIKIFYPGCVLSCL